MTLQAPTDIKAALAGITALGGRIALDEKRENETYPNVTMVPDISVVPALRGDQHTIGRSHQGQVDLWQTVADEDDALLAAVVAAIDGLKMTPDSGLLRVQVTQWVRLQDPDFDVIHHAITYSMAALQLAP
jgi:hypothetical protein